MQVTALRAFVCEELELRRLLSITPAPFNDVGQRLPDMPAKPGQTLGVVPSLPPTGPIDPVAEYEPMEGLVISWMTYTSILGQMTKRVTDAAGRVYIGVTSASVQTSATSTLTGLGVNMSLVSFFTLALNSVWSRDYGPRYVYEGDVRVITDHQYNRPTRPNDDQQPVVFGNLKKQQVYQIGLNGTSLIHGGGNFHLNATGDAYATRLISQENPSFTETQIQQIWNTYEGDNVTLTDRFPTGVDSTGHIDMWMQIYADNKVFVSDWPNNVGSAQDVICDNTATLMQSRGYQVTRIPAYSLGAHYTFANMVIFNNIVLLPQYNNGPGSAISNQVFAQVQAAFGANYNVYQINADQIVTAAGVFHCICQHLPVHKGAAGANGGLAPTAYLRGPNDGETFNAGDNFTLQWITDDDATFNANGGVQGVDIELSTDGGQTWTTTIASNQPALGSFNWTVPSGIDTAEARIRAVARDGQNNTGFDITDQNFTIGVPVANGIWTGNGDGTNWTNPANWSNNHVPTSLDDVVINVPASDPTINITGDQSVRSLNSTESLHISGALAIVGTDQVVRAAALSFELGGALDLRANDLILDYTGTSTIGDTQLQINAGQILSTTAQANPLHNTTLGAMESLDYRSIYGPSANFDNAPHDDSAVLVKYTYFGDADFNGIVNFDDYSRTDAGFINTRTGWLNGDFDGNGLINFDDYSLIDLAFNSQAGAL